jgi:hypothetical protein
MGVSEPYMYKFCPDRHQPSTMQIIRDTAKQVSDKQRQTESVDCFKCHLSDLVLNYIKYDVYEDCQDLYTNVVLPMNDIFGAQTFMIVVGTAPTQYLRIECRCMWCHYVVWFRFEEYRRQQPRRIHLTSELQAGDYSADEKTVQIMNCFNHSRQAHDDCVIRQTPDEELNKVTETRGAFDSDEQPSDSEAGDSEPEIDHKSLE